MEQENNIAIYQDADGALNVSVHFAEDDVWLTQKQLAEVCANTIRVNARQKSLYTTICEETFFFKSRADFHRWSWGNYKAYRRSECY